MFDVYKNEYESIAHDSAASLPGGRLRRIDRAHLSPALHELETLVLTVLLQRLFVLKQVQLPRQQRKGMKESPQPSQRIVLVASSASSQRPFH